MSFKLSKYHKNTIGIITILIANSISALSQDSLSNKSQLNHQVWIDFYPHFYINEQLEYYGDAGYRTIVGQRSWNRIYARPSVRYHINKTWQLSGGLGLFYIYNKLDANRLEITPWQGVQANWPNWGNLSFKHLGKIEERISWRTDNWSNSLELRFRYKLSGKFKFSKKNENSYWYVPAYAEFFFPINDNIEEFFRNRGRAGLGAGYSVSKTWDFELVFNWQTSRVGPEAELKASDLAYQLKIKKHWNKN